MCRGKGEVVIKEYLVTKPNRKRFSAWPLDSLARVSAEEIQMNDLYKTYQGVF